MGEGSDDALSRRALIAAFGTVAISGCATGTAHLQKESSGPGADRCPAISRVVDLTYTLTEDFAFGSPPRFWFQAVEGSGKDAGMRLNRLSLVEHTGTHLDAPSHFDAAQADVSRIPLDDLVVPLAVMDMRERAATTRNFSLRPEDIMAWEAVHGRLPERGCLALWTGFDFIENIKRMDKGATVTELDIPGFAPETADWLIANRSLKGVALDAGSIDSGDHVPEYPFHRRWLRDGRWGIELMTNLGNVPPSGATLIVGVAPIKGATGLPVRAFAIL